MHGSMNVKKRVSTLSVRGADGQFKYDSQNW